MTPVPDVPVCVELNINKGGCVKIVSGQNFNVDDKNLLEGQTWWDIRNQMILLPASSWVEIKKFIVEICKTTNQCQAQVSTWERSVQIIDDQLSIKGDTD